MSAAEAALLGVGILCNAMQIITFAKDAIHVYRNIRDGRAPDPKLDSYLKNAKASFYEMNQTAAQMGPLSNEQQKIVDVGNKVHDCVDELQKQFAKLHVDERLKKGFRGKMATLKKSALALWRGKELQDAEENLQRYEQLMHGLLLDRVCSQSQAAEIASLESYQNLQVSLQTIISELEHGSTNVADLFAAFSTGIGNRVADEHATTRALFGDCVTSAETKICQSMSQSIDELRRELLDREQDKAFEKQYEQLLSSLRFPEMNSRKNKISNNYPGTFTWIFDRHGSWQFDCGSSSKSHLSDISIQVSEDVQDNAKTTKDPRIDSFVDWLESESNVFWVSGKPASGKSLLMKFLAFSRLTVDHLKVWRSDIQILTHFFWKPGQTLQRNIEGMVLSLLHQVLDGKPGHCRRLCEAQSSVRNKRSYPDWSLEELSAALIWALEASSEAFCIFLDGLDEAVELQHLPCPEWTSAEVIHKLLQVDNIKLCASSREENAFCSFFRGACRLRIHQLNERDIALFIRERLDISVFKCRDRNALVYEILMKAEGVFLWVALVVDRLNRAIRQGNATIKMLEERVEQTPSDLNTLYTDMWGRIGDDAQLRSIRGTASLYFNLVITAREVEDNLSKEGHFFKSAAGRVSSLIVMATAAQDTSMEAILSAGRVMTIEELLAKCSMVEKEVLWACRGILEVTKTPDAYNRSHVCTEDKRLSDYNLTNVDFIHRTAFDFLMDTELGRECLDFRGSSKCQHASRLVAAHLVRARFLHLKCRYRSQPMNVTLLSCRRDIDYDAYLQMAISMSCDDRIFRGSSVEQDMFLTVEMPPHQEEKAGIRPCSLRDDSVLQDGLLEALKEWQSSGLFSGRKYHTPLAYSPSGSNSLELHMIETIISVMLSKLEYENSVVGLMSLLEKYSASIFLHAIPAILRAISLNCFQNGFFGHPFKLLEYILSHLQWIARQESQYQAAVKGSIFTLHCWYITNCLANLTWPRGFIRDKERHLLTDLGRTVDREDWEHTIILQFQADNGMVRRSDPLPENIHYALVAVNLATAHRIFNRVLLRYSSGTPCIPEPDSTSSRFDVVLVADMYHRSTDKVMSTVNCYAPNRRFHDRIKHFLLMELFGDVVLERRKTWPEILECSDSMLSPIDASKAYNCVMDEFKAWGMDILLPLVSLGGCSRN